MLKLLLAMSIALFFGFAKAHDFSEGQVWSYRTRAGEESSTLLIDKVDSDPKLGSIYHISVFKVRVKNSHSPTGSSIDLPHFPVSKETLEKSCVKQVGRSKPNPEYREGYAQWKQAFEQGQAGIFTISVAEIVDVVEKTLGK